jgi:hypothetical protein
MRFPESSNSNPDQTSRNQIQIESREPGTLAQGGALFSLVPLVRESNPKLQGGWCKPQPPAHRGI